MPQIIAKNQKRLQKIVCPTKLAQDSRKVVMAANHKSMTRIIPFRAVSYNQKKINDLAKVVCPPYDVIPPSKQQYYYNLEQHNFIRILLGKNISGQDKYRRSARYFKDWLKNKIFIQDEKPAIYFYSQQYNLKGEKRIRLGFIGLLSLNSPIFGHEHTHLEPKEDRLRLLRKAKANLSPIFVLFLDRRRVIKRIYQQHIQQEEPFIDIIDSEKVIHKLWRLDSLDILDKIQTQMRGENIFIADGHHRYEVACAYRDEMKHKLGSVPEEENFNYIMAYFTNADSRDLDILPVHRLLKIDLKTQDLHNLRQDLSDYFYVEEVKGMRRFFFLMEKAGSREHVLGIYKDKKYWLLRLKNIKILDRIAIDKSGEYKSLDVSILNYIILEKILGVDLEDKERVVFSHNAYALIESVDNNSSQLALFLNSVKAQKIISLALNNEKMPAKTTYFYPKVLSGLVINKF